MAFAGAGGGQGLGVNYHQNQKELTMDYKASGAPKAPKGQPRHQEHNAFGGKKVGNKRPTKEELLAKMKANAQKAEKEK